MPSGMKNDGMVLLSPGHRKRRVMNGIKLQVCALTVHVAVLGVAVIPRMPRVSLLF